jgi:hypothetical protein
MTTTNTKTVLVTIEGTEYHLDDREYSGAEIRALAGIPEKDKLVREEPDGSETAIPPGKEVRPKEEDNFFVTIRFRRG